MSSDSLPVIDLLDLKLLPAWVKEPAESKSYEHYTGEEDRHPRNRKEERTRRTPKVGRPGTHRRDDRNRERGRNRRAPDRNRRDERPRAGDRHAPSAPPKPPDITIRFLPRQIAFDNVIDQIKSGAVAYSLFHLARLFLQKPERYDVRLTTKQDSPF